MYYNRSTNLGDFMTVLRSFKDEMKLLPYQLEIIIGSLLGDAHLSQNPYSEWFFSKGQSKYDIRGKDKRSYLDWHFDVINPLSKVIYDGIIRRSKKSITTLKQDKYLKYVFHTHAHPCFFELAEKWYKMDGDQWMKNKKNKHIKIVPQDLKLTPLSLCVWLMDDGFCYPKDANAILCTHGFTVEEVDFLVERLKIDLNITAKRRIEWRGYPIIYIGRESYFDMIEMIKPYVKWDCFQYKIDTTTYNKKPHRGETHSRSKITEEDVKKVFELRKSGMLQKDIAVHLGLSKPAISLILSGQLWKHLGMKIETKKKPRISKDTITKAIELDNEGLSQLQIAEILGTSQASINRILKRKLNAAD